MANTSHIQIWDKTFALYLSSDRIQDRIKEMARLMNADLKDERPLFIAVLNGAFMFAADLFKSLAIDAEITFVKLASYKGMNSSGQITTAIGLETDLHDRVVVILEDIIDTGKTLHEFLPQVHQLQARKLLTASLLLKPDALQHAIKTDYLGFTVPDQFLIGYGLDYEGLGRNLPDIYRLIEEK